MGIRGYVQVKSPEYGNCCLSSWVAEQCARFMEENGVTLYRHYGDDEQWEIEVDDSLEAFIGILVENPDVLDERLDESLRGNHYGNNLLALLEEGLEAATKENMSYITIDWF